MTEKNPTPDEFDGSVDLSDAQLLEHLYWDCGWSTVDIASKTDVSPRTVSHKMEEHGIDRRERYDAIRTAVGTDHAYHYIGGGGYEECVSLYNGERSYVKIHRLLAVAEHGVDAVEGKHIHHKNGIPWDNRPENIEVLTPTEHHRRHTRGENNPQSKLTEAEAREVKRLANEGDMTQREIADKYDLSQSVVSNIKNGEKWGWI